MTVTVFTEPVQMYRNNYTEIDVVITDDTGKEIDYTQHVWQSEWRLTENSPVFIPGLVTATKTTLTISFTSEQTAMMNGDGGLDLATHDAQGTHYWFKVPTTLEESYTQWRA